MGRFAYQYFASISYGIKGGLMYICRMCGYKGDMESVEGIPRCPDCGGEDCEDYLEYQVDRAEYLMEESNASKHI